MGVLDKCRLDGGNDGRTDILSMEENILNQVGAGNLFTHLIFHVLSDINNYYADGM